MAAFTVSVVCPAFDFNVVGSRVLYHQHFLDEVEKALDQHDMSKDRVSGQHELVMPKSAYKFVSSGEGLSTNQPEDYTLRLHRGRVSAFLLRKHAAPIQSLKVIVYSVEAYLADPEIDQIPGEADRVRTAEKRGITHVVVAVIASAAPQSPRTPYRFVVALSGGNNEADTWTLQDIREMATESVSHWDRWCVVADEEN